MPGPLFSVIIPTYGRPHFLAEAVDSVLAQTVDDFEIVLVDDASPESIDAPDDPRIRVIRREVNGGPAAARNTGLRHARGRYVTFLDDDDLYTPERLALAQEGLRRAPVSICWIRFVHAAPRTNRVLEGGVYDTILDHFAPHIGTVSLERASAPLFDERFLAAEDTEWWLRLSREAPVSTVPRVGYLMRHHQTPRHLITTASRIEGRRLLLRLHAAYFASHPRAEAFQWKRIGLLAKTTGDFGLARDALRRSFSLRPSVRTLWHLATAVRFAGGVPPREDHPIVLDR
ncbi:MAG: glycosyltransferase [Armatimonadota bacterium]|nr:glycosyltransferase [Armatimonadota bacterium]